MKQLNSMAGAYAYSTLYSLRNTRCGISYTRTAAQRGFRDEAKSTGTWRSVGRRNVARVIVAAAPDTSLGIVALPGKIRPLESALYNVCKTMDVGIMGCNDIRGRNATNAKTTGTYRAIVKLHSRAMRPLRLVFDGTTDARTCKSPSAENNARRFNVRLA